MELNLSSNLLREMGCDIISSGSGALKRTDNVLLYQVRQAVDWLHSIGIIWGDGKADNIIIHPDADEAWLIDFSGGNTEDWVDKKPAGTVDLRVSLQVGGP